MKPLVLSLLLFSACAPISRHVDLSLNVPLGMCRITEVNPSFRSTVVYGLCNQGGKIIPLSLVATASQVQAWAVPIQAGSIVAGAAIVGQALKSIDAGVQINP